MGEKQATTIVKTRADGEQPEGSWLADVRADAFSMVGGWINSLTGRGDPERDKGAANAWIGGVLMQPETLRSLYTFNALSRAICNALSEWALRNGWDLTLDRDAVESKKIEAGVRTRVAELGAHESLLRAGIWGQTFGGGLILVGADDGRSTRQPLDEQNIKTIRFLRVVPRSLVRHHEVYSNPELAKYGETATYEVRERATGLAGAPATIWHESRVIFFPGPTTDDETRLENEGWDQSILDVVVNTLSKHDAMWDNVGAAVEDASQGVWKIKDLALAASTGLGDKIEARMKLADKARSMFRSMLLDADKEDFQYVHRDFGGVSDLLGQSAVRTAAAAQMPVTVLMGQSPAGLNATGDSDLELWYARVGAYQTGVAVSRVERLVRLILLSKDGPTEGIEPDSWAVKLADPRSLTPMQRAELRARQAQVDGQMISAKVLTPEEVAISRYTSEGWSDVTQIDLGWRRDFLEHAQAEIAKRAEELFNGMLARWLALAPQGVQADPSGGDPAIPPPQGPQAPNNPATGAVE